MKVLINNKRSVLQKVEIALHEFYSRSIYKKMVDDFTGATYRKNKQQNNITTHKKSEVDKNDDLPNMLFI